MRDAQLEPDYVYETDPPEVIEMQCPEGSTFDCKDLYDRPGLWNHYVAMHGHTHGIPTKEEIEVLFENERERRYGR